MTWLLLLVAKYGGRTILIDSVEWKPYKSDGDRLGKSLVGEKRPPDLVRHQNVRLVGRQSAPSRCCNNLKGVIRKGLVVAHHHVIHNRAVARGRVGSKGRQRRRRGTAVAMVPSFLRAPDIVVLDEERKLVLFAPGRACIGVVEQVPVCGVLVENVVKRREVARAVVVVQRSVLACRYCVRREKASDIDR